MNRRDFLKGLLAWGGVAAMPLSGCANAVSGAWRPVAYGAEKLAALPQEKNVWAWLRMFETGNTYRIPTSQMDYLQHRNEIDVAMPTNGGRLAPDGSWRQEPWRLDPPWPRSLPAVAAGAGHVYVPIVDNDKANMEGYVRVLDSPELQARAADNLVRLATSERFDAPWDGVLLDFESTPASHVQQLADFHDVLAGRLRQVGLFVGISVGGRADSYGRQLFPRAAEAADFMDLRCYGYRGPRPRSIGPYWYLEESVEFALEMGIRPEQLLLGIGNFSKYWPDPSQLWEFAEITYLEAMRLVEEAGATVAWIEQNENGLVREEFAEIGEGQLWIHSALTFKHGLELIDQYGLRGLSLFAVGMGNDAIWDVIDAWRPAQEAYLPNVSSEPATPEPYPYPPKP